MTSASNLSIKSALPAQTDSLDTNIPLRAITHDNLPLRARVIRYLDTSKNLHYLSDIALSEIVYVLTTQYNYTRVQIIDGLNFFLTRYGTKIKYNHALTAIAFPMFLAHPKLSFNDCLISAQAEITKHQPLITLDRKLANQSPSAKFLPRA